MKWNVGALKKATDMVQQKYFSTNKCSIIGDVRLNFSVRNGKR